MLSRPAVWSVGTRGVGAAFGFLSVLLVSHRLSPAEQGIYYTYASLLALLTVAEFGLSYAVMQGASHNSVEWTAGGHAVGDPGALRHLATLARRAFAWLAVESVLAGATLLVVGAALLGTSPAGAAGSARPLWAVTLVAGICWQLVNPFVSVLEGAGRVTGVWRLRFLQEVAGGLVLCGALAARAGVASFALSYAARALVGAAVVYALYRHSGLPRGAADPAFRWRETIWPFQWRVGASTLSGYILFQSFAPLMLVLAGPVVAGQFGMTLAITNAVLAATTGWPASQAPRYGALIARGAFRDLDAAFARTAVGSALLSLAGVATALAAVSLLGVTDNPLRARLLPPAALAWIVSTAFLNHLSITLATYLRAFRREPLLIPSVAGSLVTFGVMAACARWSTVEHTAVAYFLLTALGLVLTVAIFVYARRHWQAERSPASPAATLDGALPPVSVGAGA